jgi:hypothetical protein
MLIHPGLLFHVLLPVSNSEQFQYLLKGSVNDVRPSAWLKANLDPKQRQLWDPSVRFIRVLPISEKLPQEQRLHWRCKYMWPMSDREYIYARKVHKFPKHNAIITLSKATSVSRLPETFWVVRISFVLARWVWTGGVPGDERRDPGAHLVGEELGVCAERTLFEWSSVRHHVLRCRRHPIFSSRGEARCEASFRFGAGAVPSGEQPTSEVV